MLSTTDPDASNTFTYTLVGGAGSADNASFTIQGNQLVTAASFKFEIQNTYSIRVRSTDQEGLSTEKAFTISVTNVNEAPTDIAISAAIVAESRPSGTTVGTLSTTDPDAANTFTYALVGGAGSADNASFTIQGNQLVTAASFKFEVQNTYSIRVRSTDQGGLSTEKVFTISVGVPGIGVAAAGAAIASGQATAIPLGSVVKGAVAVATTFTVSNPGSVALEIGSPTLPDGVRVVTALPASIPAGGTAPLVVSLDSAAVRAVSGSITIPSSAPAGTFSIPVSGTVYSKPDAPTGVSSFWAAATRVTVSWTAASSNLSPLTASSIFALQVGTLQWVKVADNIPGSATTFDVPVTIVGGKSIPDITQGWAFKVASRNAAGVSPLSSGGKYLMAPIAPAAVVAAAAGPGAALVTWQHAVQPWDGLDKAYRPLTGYVLFYREPGSDTWTRFGDLPVVTSVTVTGLVTGKSYQFTLRAKSDSGGSLLSKVSNTLVVG